MPVTLGGGGQWAGTYWGRSGPIAGKPPFPKGPPAPPGPDVRPFEPMFMGLGYQDFPGFTGLLVQVAPESHDGEKLVPADPHFGTTRPDDWVDADWGDGNKDAGGWLEMAPGQPRGLVHAYNPEQFPPGTDVPGVTIKVTRYDQTVWQFEHGPFDPNEQFGM